MDFIIITQFWKLFGANTDEDNSTVSSLRSILRDLHIIFVKSMYIYMVDDFPVIMDDKP